MHPLFDLSGKVAIVTGGYSGIGRGIAEGLAEFGANLVICARHFEKCGEACEEIQKQYGVSALPVKCDVRDKRDIEGMVAASLNEFGKVDILVNNAGIGGAAKPFTEITDAEWDNTLSVNLRGVLHCSRAIAPAMIERGRGKIINVMSGASFRPIRNSIDYCASKAGGWMLSQVMALELIKHHIHVNTICPGFFESNLSPEYLGKARAKAAGMIPIGRMGSAKDIKGLAVFLASEASDYMVGASIVIDGGVNLK